jgi:hypothetical protein
MWWIIGGLMLLLTVLVGVFCSGFSCGEGYGRQEGRKQAYEQTEHYWQKLMVRSGLARWSINDDGKVFWEWQPHVSQYIGQGTPWAGDCIKSVMQQNLDCDQMYSERARLNQIMNMRNQELAR